MEDNQLLIEGDTNFSPERKHWAKGLTAPTQDTLERDARVFLHQSLSTPCLDVLESCEGIYLTNMQGRRYMDFHGNSVHQLGHRNPYVLEKVKSQMDILPFCPRRFTNNPIIELSEKLVSLTSGRLNRVLYCPGGTSAVGMALKLARRVTGRSKIVSYADSFHGASLDAIEAGGEEQFKKYMGDFPNTLNIPAPDTYRGKSLEEGEALTLDSLEKIFRKEKEVGAFMAETIRNTDVQIPSPSYWIKVKELCKEYQVLLILDEIPIAFGRTGKMFAFEHYGITPDILVLGKGLGAGIIPMAAILTKDEFNIATDISLGHYTFEKNPLGAAAGLAMLELIERDQLLSRAIQLGEWLTHELQALQKKHPIIGDIRGRGLLWGIDLVRNRETKERAVEEASRVMYNCLERGLSFKVSKGNVIQWAPPIIINDEELWRAVAILDEALGLLH